MKKYIQQLTFGALLSLLLAAGVVSSVHASVSPTLTLNNLNNGFVQLTVNADPDATIQLYYYNPTYNNNQYYSQYSYNYSQNTYSNIQSIGVVGYTDNSGYFSNSVSDSQYNVPSGDYVYAVVDGIASQGMSWPASSYYAYGYSNTNNYTAPAYGTIYLSQDSMNVNAGQSQIVTIYGSGSYYVSSNSNSNVASVSVSGNTLDVYTLYPGIADVSVCQTGGSCVTLNITVLSNGNNSYTYPYTNTTYPYGYNAYTQPTQYVAPLQYQQQYVYNNYTSPAQYAYPGNYYGQNYNSHPGYYYHNFHYYPFF